MGIANKVLFFLGLLRARATGHNIPLTVIFNVTNRCNSVCGYCYAKYYARENSELSKDQIFSIVDELVNMGTRRISLSGGEPLLRQDIGEIIAYIKDKGIDCILNTNGLLVTERIEDIKAVDAICISLDGPGNVHDSYRGKGSYKKVIEAIRCARENNFTVHTNTVLHRKNVDSIDFILRIAKRYNLLAEFNVSIACLYDEEKDADYKNGDVKIKRALQKLIKYKEKGYPILFSKKAFEYTLAWPSYRVEAFFDVPPDFEHTRCSAGKFFCLLDTNGDVYPCPHLIDKVTPVNAVRSGLREAFKGLDRHNCRACYQVYHNEFNLLYQLDRSVILNHVMNSLKTLFLHRNRGES